MSRDFAAIRKWIGVFAVCLPAVTLPTTALHAEDWLPISPEELKMTGEPKAPAAPAIFLYRQVDRDDNAPGETVYARIKILTEEGRKYGDIEIPYNRVRESIRAVQARTIRPDGSVIPFDGTIYEKPIVQGGGVKLLAKTFTMPDVQVGSIIEYRYRHNMESGFVFDSHWILSQDLFTKHARFTLSPYTGFSMRFSWPVGLPAGTEPPKRERGVIRLETRDVPAFVTEEYMPPANELKYRVDFIYSDESSLEKEPEAFWKKFGKQSYRKVDNFTNKRRVMEQAVAEIVAPGDTPDVKLRKLYARVQQVRNLSYERAKSDQEVKREAYKEANDVAELWSKGYGYATEITWLFLGLVRAAGFEADPVLVSTRDVYFFDQRMMNPRQLNSNVVSVKLDGKDLYLDPGIPYAPFGLLPWNEAGVRGLRLTKDGGTWVETKLPAPEESRIERNANFRLLANGTLEGKVTVTYTGLEAFSMRLEAHNEDETERKQILEDQIDGDVPSGIDVTATSKPDWDSSDAPLIVEYELKIIGWASSAGQRTLLPIGIFGRGVKDTFKRATRVHSLYFDYPSKSSDDINIEMPAGWKVNSMPQAHSADLRVIKYATSVQDKSGSLHISRELTFNLLLLDKKFYSQLRDFFQTVRTKDEEQVVIAPGKTSGKDPGTDERRR